MLATEICSVKFHSLITCSFIIRASKICAAVYKAFHYRSPAFFFKESLNISAESAFVFCMIFNYSCALMHIRSFGWKPRWISGTHSKCLITHFKKRINPPCFLYLFTLVAFCSMSMKCFHLLFAVFIDLVIRRVGSDLSPSLKCHFNNRSPNFLFLYKHGLACSAFCGFLYS